MDLARPLLWFVGFSVKTFILLRVELFPRLRTRTGALFTIIAISLTVYLSMTFSSTIRCHTYHLKIELGCYRRLPGTSRWIWKTVIAKSLLLQWISTHKCTPWVQRSITLMWRCRLGKRTALGTFVHGRTSNSHHSSTIFAVFTRFTRSWDLMLTMALGVLVLTPKPGL